MLLKLPDEVLLNIVLRVDTRGTLNFGLACRRLQPIAREALIKKAHIKPQYIWNFVATLQQNPGWVRDITHLALGPVDYHALFVMRNVESYVFRAITKTDFFACCTSICDAVKASSAGSPDLWLETWASGRHFSSMGLSILLAQCLQLEAISVSISYFETESLLWEIFCYNNLLDPGPRRLDKWHKTVRQLLQNRLRGLEITRNPAMHLNGHHRTYERRRVMLTGFVHLRHLVVPYEQIINLFPHNRVILNETLPAGLVHLRIDYCDPRYPLGSKHFVDQLTDDRKAFPYMHDIELRFECGSDCLYSHPDSKAIIDTFQRWQASTVRVVMSGKEPITGDYMQVDLVAKKKSAWWWQQAA
ncbi:hypothetical protein EKO04_000991 [Ascochyta lentis]|uniref:F-box domain-containing protein n=1 Tax=Ascochyta lentis TaxID=205686 RepID=A0A8H7JED4_9PLEO|nr:hypothetical protein EKO04_000991 [Ascochyta lentis]